MSIRAMSKQADRVSKAAAVCDDCGREEVVTCDYEGRRAHEWTPNVGQLHRKMMGKGWSVVSGGMRCPSCDAKRKAHNIKPKEVVPMVAVVDAPREPTQEQKRDILLVLHEVYDLKAKRYRGAETDATVAEAVGGGVLWGWVAKLREEFFGPDGSEEIDALMARAENWLATGAEFERSLKACRDQVGDALRDLEQSSIGMREIKHNLQKMKAALGPKVRA